MPNARPTEVDPLGVINLIGSNLIDRYPPASILKELLQNADDAGARTVVVGWTAGLAGRAGHPLLQGPALFVVNDGELKDSDARAICRFGQNYKFGEKAVIGKFGLGLKSVFHLCEAFFYLSSKATAEADDGLFNNLASPWANTDYHRGWNAVKEEDLCLLRDHLRPIWSPLGEHWFALWLPLRRAVHCNGVRFSGRFDGDRPLCPPELSGRGAASEIARALPLLHSIQVVQFWECWEPGRSTPSAEVRLEASSARSRFRKCVELGADACGDPSPGRYVIRAEHPASVAYTLAQSWSADLLPLTERDDWPKSFVLTGGQQPDKAQPHAAVALARRTDRAEGGVDVVRAVFLPLETQQPTGPVTAEFLLTLHGCFFVDSGRRHALHMGEDVRGEWNRRLMTQGVLPLILPAVESFAKTEGADDEVVRRLTQALGEWMNREGTRTDACRTHAWVYRWLAEGPHWERVESGKRIVEIPAFGTDAALPSRAMPGLRDMAGEFVLTPAGHPRLTRQEPGDWPTESLGRALTVGEPESLFEDGGKAWGYYHDFLQAQGNLGNAGIAALRATLRKVFAQVGTGSLRGPGNSCRDWTRALIRRLPANLRLGLALGGNWPDEARRDVCGSVGGVLIVPDEFDSSDPPGTGRLTADEAVGALERLARHTGTGRNSNPSLAAVINADESGQVLRRTELLRLWRVDRVTFRGREPQVASRAELSDGRPLFAGDVTRAVEALTGVLASGEAWVVPADVARVVVPGVPTADVGGVLALLIAYPALAEPGPDFVRLLEVLRSARQVPNWRVAVRYLFHRRPNMPDDDVLLVGDHRQGVWGKLATAALAAEGEPERVIPTSELTRALDPALMDALGLAPLDATGVARLVSVVGPGRVVVDFTQEERAEVLIGLRQYPDLIRSLPLHDWTGGGMARICENSYWVGTGQPGTLSRHIRLLRTCGDPELAAIQRKAHPVELTPVEVVRRAIQHGPAEHWQTLLTALQSTGTLPRELRAALADQAWIPLAAGGRAAPANVLHDEQFSEQIVAALRAVPRAPEDPVTWIDLSQDVRGHPGGRELARQLFPDRERLVTRLVSVLKRDSRFRVGGLDLRSREERADWVEAFRDAPTDVMAACSLIGRVDAADPDLCVERLLPPLRDGCIPVERLERILAFLRDRHSQGRGPRQAILRVHNLYLRLAADDRDAFKAILPRLRLLSEAGEWSDPANLCVAEGLDRARTLDGEQRHLLDGRVSRQPVLPELMTAQPGEQQAQARVAERHFRDSVHRLRDYFANWRAPEEVAGWAGAFLALLGDYEPLQQLANDFLETASPGRTVGYVRTQAGMREAQLLLERMKRAESPSELMARARVLFEVTDLSRPAEVLNLLGGRIRVDARADFDTLFVGFGMDRVECPHLGGWRIHCLHLRAVNPASLPRHRLRELVTRTGDLVLRVFYGQLESQIDFGHVLAEFSGDDAFGVRVAQESFLNGTPYVLQFLGLTGTPNARLRELLRLSEAAANRRSEESAVDPGRVLPGRSALSLEVEVRDRLRELVGGDPGVQEELAAAVRRKVREYRYEPRSVLFELFQNADDAYAEHGCPTDISSVFLCQQSALGLDVLHNGRPINRSIGDRDPEAGAHRHDLRKMLSLGHSDKGFGPAAGNVTGRFGLGFKSVFLITDRPRVVSGRLAFEVLGGVYPQAIEHGAANALRGRVEVAGLPRETGTIFQLPVRNDVKLADVVEPFRRLAHYLVAFARRIRAVGCQAERATWAEQIVVEAGNARVVVGLLHPICGSTHDLGRAVVVRCGQRGDVLFGLNDHGFSPVPVSVPSVWVTAPTAECHGVGYLVNAPQLDLDVGRSQVTWDSAANADRLRELGLAVGDALVALFDAGTSGLDLAVDGNGVWQSLWEIVSRPGQRRELHRDLMWGESGAALRLYTERPAIPTGIAARPFDTLTSIPDIQYVLGGILDDEESDHLIGRVVSWDGFDAKDRPGSVVANQKVWSRLRGWCPNHRPECIDLATILRNELRRSKNIDPGRATRLSTVIDRDLLRRMKHGTPAHRNEHAALEPQLRCDARFRSQEGTWLAPAMLLIPPNDASADYREEVMRSSFAPPDRVLADDYAGPGVDFFLACRAERSAPLDEMARWAKSADTESMRSAVLRYLREGEQHFRLQAELQRIGIAGTWLAQIDRLTLQSAGYDDRQQTTTLVMLGLVAPDLAATPVPTVPQPPQPDAAKAMFARIATWWREQGPARIREYNQQIYPEGVLPRLTTDGPGSNPDSRVEWLKFFMTCIVQTVGRVTPDQNRAFVRLCNTERWLATLADPANGPREWLAAVERYIDRHSGEGIRYFHWLRHFVGVATVSRHLDAYVGSFLAIDRFEGLFTPRDALTTRTSRQFQFGGPDAPTLAPILGIGASFALRELFRMGLINREDVHPFCYPAVARLRRFLERLGWQEDDNGAVSERSRSIYEFVATHHPDDPTFGNAFDIPLLMYQEVEPDPLPTRPRDGDFVTLGDGRVIPRSYLS
jgi:hypothetical protein